MVLAADEVPAQSVGAKPGAHTRSGTGSLVLRTTVSGSIRVDVGGSPVEAAPGDLLVLDLARPIRMEDGAGPGATLFLPRRTLGDRADELASMHGGVLGGSALPIGPAAVGLPTSLQRIARVSATPGLTHHLVPATVDLCRALAWEVSGSATAAPSGDTQLRFAVQQFIEQHLAQVDLPMLSAQFGLSRTPLYSCLPLMAACTRTSGTAGWLRPCGGCGTSRAGGPRSPGSLTNAASAMTSCSAGPSGASTG